MSIATNVAALFDLNDLRCAVSSSLLQEHWHFETRVAGKTPSEEDARLLQTEAGVSGCRDSEDV